MTRRFLDQIAWFFFYQFQHTELSSKKMAVCTLIIGRWQLSWRLSRCTDDLQRSQLQIDTSDIWIFTLRKERFSLCSVLLPKSTKIPRCKLGNFLSLASRWIIFRNCLCKTWVMNTDITLLSCLFNPQYCFKVYSTLWKCNNSNVTVIFRF